MPHVISPMEVPVLQLDTQPVAYLDRVMGFLPTASVTHSAPWLAIAVVISLTSAQVCD